MAHRHAVPAARRRAPRHDDGCGHLTHLHGRHSVIKEIGHGSFMRRIAINVGAGYVPGLNAVVKGAALSAGRMGWEIVGIRDGFDGLLHPERYPDGGLVTLSPELVENLDPSGGGFLGQSGRVDPFHVRRVNEDEIIEGSRHVRRPPRRVPERGARRADLRRRGPRAEHPLQAPPQGAPHGLRPPVDRERHRRHRGLLRLQQRAQLHDRDARPGPPGGPVGPQDRGGGGPGRAVRLGGAPGRPSPSAPTWS
ncbi:MAG: 6-phosphofructokinase [Holophagales bacterium]|nr:6-phosphofructokinase [Holophagales bacterium]